MPEGGPNPPPTCRVCSPADRELDEPMRREPRKAEPPPGPPTRRKTVRDKSRPAKETYMVWTTFLKRMRELREEAGLSLADVAERAGMDKGFVSRLETGRGNPTVATLARYAAVLGVRVVFGVEATGGRG